MFTFIGVRIKSAPGCQIRVPLVYISSVFAFQSSSEIVCHFIEFRAGTVSISVSSQLLILRLSIECDYRYVRAAAACCSRDNTILKDTTSQNVCSYYFVCLFEPFSFNRLKAAQWRQHTDKKQTPALLSDKTLFDIFFVL